MNPTHSTSRRRFLGQAAAAIAAPTILPSGLLGQNAPSKRVAMGFIGLGNRGMGVMEAFLNHAEVQGVAVCDVDDLHFRQQGEKKSRDYGRTPGKAAMEAAHAKRADSGSWKGCTAYEDFRELIARDDIDCNCLAVPGTAEEVGQGGVRSCVLLEKHGESSGHGGGGSLQSCESVCTGSPAARQSVTPSASLLT